MPDCIGAAQNWRPLVSGSALGQEFLQWCAYALSRPKVTGYQSRTAVGEVIVYRVGLIALCVWMAGCATITRGTMQSVSVNTPNVSGAVCTLSSTSIGTRTITAPATVSLEKGQDSIAVHCKKQCYTDGVGTLVSSVEAMTAGNILVGGVIGLGVDAASGTINKYEPGVEIRMTPIKGCRSAPAA
jgi:hypothetical protein